MTLGFIWASRRCHSLDAGIVRDFQLDLILAVIGALDDSTVGLIVGLIVGSAISTLGSKLSHFLFLPFSVVDDRSAVAETMISMPLISLPARVQEDGEVMEHFRFRNNVFYGLTAHGLATDHAKKHASARSRVVNYPAHKLNFHSCPATTQPWEE